MTNQEALEISPGSSVEIRYLGKNAGLVHVGTVKEGHHIVYNTTDNNENRGAESQKNAFVRAHWQKYKRHRL